MGVVGAYYAICGWSTHGECGRHLLGVFVGGDIIYFCGCFRGNDGDLIKYIKDGEPKYEKSRTLAREFVKTRIEEMVQSTGGGQ